MKKNNLVVASASEFSQQHKYSTRVLSVLTNYIYNPDYGRFHTFDTLNNAKFIPTILSGNTSSRPISPTVGQIYFDTDLQKLVVCNAGRLACHKLVINTVSVSVDTIINITINGEVKSVTVSATDNPETLAEKIRTLEFTDAYILNLENATSFFIFGTLNSKSLTVSIDTVTGVTTTLTTNEANVNTNWVDVIPTASSTVYGTVKKAVTQANSTATDIAGLVNDFNALLQKLKDAGIM